MCSASELKPELLCVKHRRDGKRYVHVIEGMANAKIPDIFETSMQDWDYPDGPTTHIGLTVDKLIILMLSSLLDGNTDNVMFVSRELYLMKCFTPPIGQSSKSVYTRSLNRFYNAILHYVVTQVDVSHVHRIMYAVCQISRIFVRDPSRERFGTNDITLIVKPLLLICKCDVKDTAQLMSKIGQDVVMTNDFEKLLPDVIAKGNVFAAERCAFGLYKRAVP